MQGDCVYQQYQDRWQRTLMVAAAAAALLPPAAYLLASCSCSAPLHTTSPAVIPHPLTCNPLCLIGI